MSDSTPRYKNAPTTPRTLPLGRIRAENHVLPSENGAQAPPAGGDAAMGIPALPQSPGAWEDRLRRSARDLSRMGISARELKLVQAHREATACASSMLGSCPTNTQTVMDAYWAVARALNRLQIAVVMEICNWEDPQ